MSSLRPIPWSALVIAVALILRLVGIDWGLPGPARYWSHHPDESQVVVAAQSLNPFAGEFKTGFYNYGQGFLLAGSIVSRVGATLGLSAPQPTGLPPTAATLLWFRLVSAVAGTLSVVWLISAGSRLYDRRIGVMAGGLLAVSPLAVQHAHFATVDVFASAATILAVRFAAPPAGKASPTSFAFAGLASGIAAGTKYNAGLILSAVVAAWWISKPRSAGALAAAAACAGIGFLAACPGALLEPGRFLEDLRFEARHMGAGSEDIFAGTLPGWLHHGLANLPWAMGPVGAAGVLCGAWVAARSRNGSDAVIASAIIPYWLLIGAAQVKFARYLLPIMPFLCLWAAASLRSVPVRALHPVRVLAGVAIVSALAMAIAFDRLFVAPDTREIALGWLRNAGVRRVAFARRPWYWSPPISPGLGHFSPAGGASAAAAWRGSPAIAAPGLADEWSIDFVAASAADAVVVSEFEARDGLRVGNAKVEGYLDALRTSHPHRVVVESPLSIGPIRFGSIATRHGFPVSNLPHDMLYANPTLIIQTP